MNVKKFWYSLPRFIAQVHRPTTWTFFYIGKGVKIKYASSNFRRGEVSPVLFWKWKKCALILQRKCPDFGKKCPVFLKCSFKSILKKKHHNFSLRDPSFVCPTETFIKVPLFLVVRLTNQCVWKMGKNFYVQDDTKFAHEVQNTNASRTRKKQTPELFYESRFS